MTRILINLFVKNKEAVENMAIRNRYALLSNVTGIIVNIALCITKLLVGVSAGSVAVIADAFNNLSDAGCNIVTFLGFVYHQNMQIKNIHSGMDVWNILQR